MMSDQRRTLVLSRADVARLLRLDALIAATRAAYVTHLHEPASEPQKAVAQIGDGSATIVFPGVLAGIDCYTVKVNAKFPGNVAAGLPFLIGTILLLDRETGFPLAVLESGLITAMRTAAAGAVGVEALARSDAGCVALLGAGVQGEWQLRALHTIGRVRRAVIFDTVHDRAVALAQSLGAELRSPINAAASAEEAARPADILVTVTQSRTPIVSAAMAHPGLHINAFGADEPGKVELSTEVVRRAVVVVDDRHLALAAGALNVPYANGDFGDEVIDAEIAEVLAGERPGRTSDDQVTVFGNIGLAWQDLIAARMVYEAARAERIGTWVDLG